MKKKRKKPSLLPVSMAERYLRPPAAVIMDDSSSLDSVREAQISLEEMEGRYVLPPEYYSLRGMAGSRLGTTDTLIETTFNS